VLERIIGLGISILLRRRLQYWNLQYNRSLPSIWKTLKKSKSISGIQIPPPGPGFLPNPGVRNLQSDTHNLEQNSYFELVIDSHTLENGSKTFFCSRKFGAVCAKRKFEQKIPTKINVGDEYIGVDISGFRGNFENRS
jgi:hypothetical protein